MGSGISVDLTPHHAPAVLAPAFVAHVRLHVFYEAATDCAKSIDSNVNGNAAHDPGRFTVATYARRCVLVSQPIRLGTPIGLHVPVIDLANRTYLWNEIPFSAPRID